MLPYYKIELVFVDIDALAIVKKSFPGAWSIKKFDFSLSQIAVPLQ